MYLVPQYYIYNCYVRTILLFYIIFLLVYDIEKVVQSISCLQLCHDSAKWAYAYFFTCS